MTHPLMPKKKKKVYVAWSGGLDSTFLLMEMSRRGYEVRAGYIEMLNNRDKTARELKAIENIISAGFLDKYDVKYDGVVAKFSAEKFSGNIDLSQPLAWIIGIAYTVASDIDEVAMGYVMNDDAISYLDEITTAFNGVRALLRSSPKLVFPIKKMRKREIWDALPTNVREHLTWCESTRSDNCGECGSCKRMKAENLWNSAWNEVSSEANIDEVNPRITAN